MILTTTNSIEGKKIDTYLGVVSGIQYTPTFSTKGMTFKEMFSSKKSYEQYEKLLEDAKEGAFQKLKANADALNANAIVGIMVDVETVSSSMYTMVSIVGTAVIVA